MRRIELHAETTKSEELSFLYPEAVVKAAATAKCKAIAITDKNSVLGYSDAEEQAHKNNIHLIYGLTISCIDNDDRYDVVLLAKNLEGRDHIFRLIELLHEEEHSFGKCITREQLEAHRGGLLLGSCARNGQLVRAIQHRKNTVFVDRLLQGYDYVEFINKPYDLSSEVYRAALRNNIPVCGVQYANVIDCADSIDCHAFKAITRFRNGNGEPTVFRAGKSMEQEYKECYVLPQEQSALQKILYDDPEFIYSQIEPIPSIHDLLDESAHKQDCERPVAILRNQIEIALECKYPAGCPTQIRQRVEKELAQIETNGLAPLLLIGQRIGKMTPATKSHRFIAGVDNGWLLLYLLDFIEINPLPKHVYCSNCGFYEEVRYEDNETCPMCGGRLIGDGANLPHPWKEQGVGLLNGVIEWRSAEAASKEMSELIEAPDIHFIVFGSDKDVDEPTAELVETVAKNYIENQRYDNELTGLLDNGAFMYRIQNFLYHLELIGPTRYFIPSDPAVMEHLPIVNRGKNNSKEKCLLAPLHKTKMLRLLPLDAKAAVVLSKCEDLTEVEAASIDITSATLFTKIHRLAASDYSGEWPLLEKACQLGGISVGGLKDPLFDCDDPQRTNKMIHLMKPKSVHELTRVYCLSHGTQVWSGNAEDLLVNDAISPDQVLACREDIYNYMVEHGASHEDASAIMAHVRMGRAEKQGFANHQKAVLEECKVEKWFIASCEKIAYLFPYAHGYIYATFLLRLLWFSMNHPEAFEAAVKEVESQ